MCFYDEHACVGWGGGGEHHMIDMWGWPVVWEDQMCILRGLDFTVSPHSENQTSGGLHTASQRPYTASSPEGRRGPRVSGVSTREGGGLTFAGHAG